MNKPSRFLKALRNFVQYEWDNTSVYPTPKIQNYDTTYSMEQLLIKYSGVSKQYENFKNMLDDYNVDFLPFASTIHRYLEKFDSEWYKEFVAKTYDKYR